MDPTLASVLIAIISAAGLLAGGVYAARQVYRSNARAAELQEQALTNETAKVDLERVREFRADIAALRHDRDEDNARHHGEIVALRNDHAADIAQLRQRLNQAEIERAHSRTEIHLLTEYARVLLRLLRDAGIAYPPPPAGLDR
jgi:hypothetical protein